MILLVSNYFMSWCQNSISSTGVLNKTDSALVSIIAIKQANVKMIELKYEKEINKHLMDIIHNDSIIICNIQDNARISELNYAEDIHKLKIQRNKAIIIGSGSSLLLFILLLLSL